MKHLCRFLQIIATTLILFSCASTPNSDAAVEVLANDLSNYADYIVDNCKLPDGKTARMCVYNNAHDGERIQNWQSWKFDKSVQESRRQFIEKYHPNPNDTGFLSGGFFYWYPTGPVSPFWESYFAIKYKYGDKAANEMMQAAVSVTYYNAEDLGQLSQFMTTSNCLAQGYYEDSTGKYVLSIGSPNSFLTTISKKERKNHRDQFAYVVSYIPKNMYKEVRPLKINPAKTQPFNPSAIPDSNRNLAPVISEGSAPYYYDGKMANKMQWLAVKIACKGVYDMAYTGDFSAKNPRDYYKTSFIKNYLATNGATSKGTKLFEGVCFDYADFAYQELSENQKEYPSAKNYWMVGTFEDPNDIVAYRIANRGERATDTINRTPVVVASHNHIQSHSNAKHHAWFWVQAEDGIIYWVDPTWTDNTGKPVYGIVRNGKEIQLEPDSRYSVQ